MRIGVFGGTFNPPHIGHMIVAEVALEKVGLDTVLFMPCALPPHKPTDPVEESHHRLEMLRRAIDGNSHFAVSEIELTRGGTSYTVDTLRELRHLRPDDQLFLLIGMDNIVGFETWKEPDEILGLAQVVVLTRPGFNASTVSPRFLHRTTMCDVPEIEIASSEIRMRVKEGKSVRYLLPAGVEAYIQRHGLYR